MAVLLRRPLPPKSRNTKKHQAKATTEDFEEEFTINLKSLTLKAIENNERFESLKGVHDQTCSSCTCQKPRGPDAFPWREPKRPPIINKNELYGSIYNAKQFPEFTLKDFTIQPTSESLRNLERLLVYDASPNQTNVGHGLESKSVPKCSVSQIDEQVKIGEFTNRKPWRQWLLETRAKELELQEDIDRIENEIRNEQILLGALNECQTANNPIPFDVKASNNGHIRFQDEATDCGHKSSNNATGFQANGVYTTSKHLLSERQQNENQLKEQMLSKIKHGSKYFSNTKHPNPVVEFESTVDSLLSTCQLKGGKKLSLKALFIEQLPNLNYFYDSLVYLNISFNNFEILPKEILFMRNLKTLKLRNNPLKKIPNEINCLQNLQNLTLSFCMLDELPTSLCQLPLVKLDVSYNHLGKLPDNIKEFRQLRALNVDGNQLRYFPKSFIRLQLQEFKMANNFTNSILWKFDAKRQPQHLVDICLKTCSELAIHKNEDIDETLAKKFNRFEPCDLCSGPMYGNGIDLIKPAAELFGQKNVPILFHVCSTLCQSSLKRMTSSIQ